MNLEEWDVTWKGTPLETTNFESNGKYTGLIGIVSADWSLKGKWDSSANPLSDPPGLYPRDDGRQMDLGTEPGSSWSFPSWICGSSKISTKVSGTVDFEASGSSNGDFSPPTPL